MKIIYTSDFVAAQNKLLQLVKSFKKIFFIGILKLAFDFNFWLEKKSYLSYWILMYILQNQIWVCEFTEDVFSKVTNLCVVGECFTFRISEMFIVHCSNPVNYVFLSLENGFDCWLKAFSDIHRLIFKKKDIGVHGDSCAW